MSLIAHFKIPIEPKSLQFSGKRMMVRNGRVQFFKTSEATRYQGTIAAFARPHTPQEPLEEPLIVDFIFILPRPQRLNTKSHHPGRIPCDKRPDRDNLVKGTQDALKGFWKDDGQIFDGRIGKYYAAMNEQPHIEIRIETA
jgi:Holliday junction resolvase RusA-like endonuclease